MSLENSREELFKIKNVAIRCVQTVTTSGGAFEITLTVFQEVTDVGVGKDPSAAGKLRLSEANPSDIH